MEVAPREAAGKPGSGEWLYHFFARRKDDFDRDTQEYLLKK